MPNPFTGRRSWNNSGALRRPGLRPSTLGRDIRYVRHPRLTKARRRQSYDTHLFAHACRARNNLIKHCTSPKLASDRHFVDRSANCQPDWAASSFNRRVLAHVGASSRPSQRAALATAAVCDIASAAGSRFAARSWKPLRASTRRLASALFRLGLSATHRHDIRLAPI